MAEPDEEEDSAGDEIGKWYSFKYWIIKWADILYEMKRGDKHVTRRVVLSPIQFNTMRELYTTLFYIKCRAWFMREPFTTELP